LFYPDKTIREVNLQQQHQIPLGTLVEFYSEEWYGDGACERIVGRLWVVAHTRDCDGSPLYSLARIPQSISENASLYMRSPLLCGVLRTGFLEESLRIVPITDEVRDGSDMPQWRNKATTETQP